ncbi:NAD(P)H-dependent glycerol-3-phosphate dehydrogenase [Anaerotignum sp. MB30-C6]|uniref:NAD(P)H-dependent glycerol-3-phosphate dehydrogenase n=1 Tax=Anaerotignum sp. MB30-C6 TaxID=3070814 RepID=UPI0027DAD5C8|nr:NAD(P)H-dependent glycerol-3-phosphate dehydrogenase [Anaerotignum sp. MB30-C6]WMI81504.1 NAD(P)H-dependent glycerol-3-phosphate dehydrogenase [Anaerotignum sp. MB30-C6]
MKKVTVVGSGSWGTALAVMLQKHGHDVVVWSRRQDMVDEMENERENKAYLPGITLPEGMKFTTDHEQAVKDAEIIILSVPSKAVRQTVTAFAPFFTDKQVLVNVAKGLEEGSLKRLSQVIQECAPQCEVCILSGPSHAEEVARDIPTTCLIASENEEVAKMVQGEFMNPRFRLYTNTDVIGVEMGAALKNVMALAAGMSDGLGFGDNTKAAIMTRGIAEMKRLGVEMGGKAETFSGLSGIGDLIVTCTSMHSRNRRAGILLGQGKTLAETLEEIKMVVEGVNTVRVACQVAQMHDVEMPITSAIADVLFGGKNTEQAVLDLMSRDGKAE